MIKPRWNEDGWSCKVALPAWRGQLQSKRSHKVTVVFTPEGADPDVPPSAEQLAAVEWVVKQQKALRARITVALRRHYVAQRPMMVEAARELPHLFDDFDAQMPAKPSPALFAALHPLTEITVQPVATGKLAYVGFQFRAAWEVEHGLGVLMHRLRVIEVGGADVAILQWIAEAAARKAKKRPKPATRKRGRQPARK